MFSVCPRLKWSVGEWLGRRYARSLPSSLKPRVRSSAVNLGSRFWTLNPADFADIPGLRLIDRR
jgi:hypothetical protein